ncbi:hypothetical protein ACTHPH_11880 [Paenibacillus pasadenensis]|uniref:hypothetical protein n=1 Tax=Paenibacillus TaxID=44249 RepID=UPI0004161536|nr:MULTISPECIES: hypothetical protein [Paenibacillus]QGG55959.1 hypothetical protein GE073_10505 [Paenibacillus sp. B01]
MSTGGAAPGPSQNAALEQFSRLMDKIRRQMEQLSKLDPLGAAGRSIAEKQKQAKDFLEQMRKVRKDAGDQIKALGREAAAGTAKAANAAGNVVRAAGSASAKAVGNAAKAVGNASARASKSIVKGGIRFAFKERSIAPLTGMMKSGWGGAKALGGRARSWAGQKWMDSTKPVREGWGKAKDAVSQAAAPARAYLAEHSRPMRERWAGYKNRGVTAVKSYAQGLREKGRGVYEQHKGLVKEHGAAAAAMAGGAIVAVGTKSLEAAETFGKASSILRASAGVPGEQMGELLESFRKVGSQVPQNLDEVAKAMGTLRGSLPLTGAGLEKTSKTLLDASRLTGGDSAAMAESLAGIMNSWDVKLGDSSGTLDRFFAASRAGKTDMAALMKGVSDSAGSFQEMELGLDASTALMAKWQKAGINPIQDVLKKVEGGTMQLPEGGFEIIASQIRQAESIAEAAKLAIGVFGQEAGIDLALALRGSTDGFKGMLGSMSEASGSISAQSQQLQSFGDGWGALQNRVTIALAPLGEALLPLGEGIVTVMEVFARNADILGISAAVMAGILIGVFAPSLLASAAAAWAVAAPILAILAPVLLVGAAVAGLAYLFKYHFDDIKKYFNDFVGGILEKWNKVKGFLGLGEDATVTVAAAGPAGAAALPGHYHGLGYVPYDGMVARLHKGERVLSAQENRELSGGGAAGLAVTVTGNTFHVRQESDIDGIARALAREIRAAGGLMG